MATRLEFEANNHKLSDSNLMFQAFAGEDIGINAQTYPLAPIIKSGQILRWGNVGASEDPTKVYLMDLTHTGDYAGVAEEGAYLGDPINVRTGGRVKLAVGAVAVAAGNIVVSENTAAANPGDVIPKVDAALSDTPLSSNSHTDAMVVGRAHESGAVRAGATRSIIDVQLRGY